MLVKPGAPVVILSWRHTPPISVSSRPQPNHYTNVSYSHRNSSGSIWNSEGTREFSDQFSQQELSVNTWGVYSWVCVSNRNTFEGKGAPPPQHFQHSLSLFTTGMKTCKLKCNFPPIATNSKNIFCSYFWTSKTHVTKQKYLELLPSKQHEHKRMFETGGSWASCIRPPNIKTACRTMCQQQGRISLPEACWESGIGDYPNVSLTLGEKDSGGGVKWTAIVLHPAPLRRSGSNNGQYKQVRPQAISNSPRRRLFRGWDSFRPCNIYILYIYI